MNTATALMQLSPARGRLRGGKRMNTATALMQLSPARGRLREKLVDQFLKGRCSLSPRGDGYLTPFG